MPKQFVHHLYTTVLSTSVGASTLRGMGPAGTVAAARVGLENLKESGVAEQLFKATSKEDFDDALDRATIVVRSALLPKHRHWGTARKVVNIFLRSLAYNRHLYQHLRLKNVEKWFEVPLDSHVARGLQKHDPTLPKWDAVKRLDKKQSDVYQHAATTIALKEQVLRVDLDAYFYRADSRPPHS